MAKKSRTPAKARTASKSVATSKPGAAHGFHISGQVVAMHNGNGIPNLRVEAWDKDTKYHDMLGEAQTDGDGHFEIDFDSSYFGDHAPDRYPDLFFKVFRGRTLIHDTSDTVLWNVKSRDKTVVIQIAPGNGTPGRSNGFVVRGVVRHPDGTPAARVTVKAFDRELRGEALLGKATTDAQGSYEIHYRPAELRPQGKAAADLVVRVFD